MSTISDVAKLAGLSVSTVSRVINNQKYVTEEKREAVLKAMKALNYQPSVAARQLRGQQTNIIGVIVPRITNPFFSYLVDELQKQAYKQGFQIMIFQSDEDKKKELSFLNLMLQKQVDGIIMCAVENEEKKVSSYMKYGPIVLCNIFFNGKFEENKIPRISLNQEHGAYIGTKYLLEKGYRKLAYCTGGTFDEHVKGIERDRGFTKALNEYGLKINKDWVYVNQHTINDGKQLAHEFQKLSDKPDAIFTGSDEIAAGFIAEANRLGIKVPNDIAVLGFDNQVTAELTVPSITTVSQPIDELGKQTINLITHILANKEFQIDEEILKMNVVIRESA
ncbi:LacI family DNA-binding transcriptional regulator [Enterococcus saccharolyticus]|uniref:LacI family transcriptional regulator n=1 Tax=Candidatus Enterococcus willemsii TaxID=1857215 RepID=A0ABQ6YWA7_9ENTE|nr:MULTISPECIES: LacI family DNA-binding transcriptional regulator [Enterococcus]KAF1301988.1 LacI family transcriptional regulator [Enterococcus sp. CU12B]MCD5002905.1 LacI family DNA-binding transcriptional regulator [Enterococcus saccharolyticus]